MPETSDFWTILGRFDIAISLFLATGSVWGILKYFFKKASNIQLKNFLIWSIIGSEDEDLFVSTFKDLLKLFLSGLIWGLIGIVVGIVYFYGLAFYYSVREIINNESVVPYVVLGFISGFIFRVIFLSVFAFYISKNKRMEKEYKSKIKMFEDKKADIEKRMKQRREEFDE